MTTSYGVKRTYGTVTYVADGYSSFLAAEVNVKERAFRDGNWRPEKLKEKWWQFWLCDEYSESTEEFVRRNPDWNK